MPTAVLGILIVGGGIALALLGMLLVRRSVAIEALESHQDVAGFIIAVVGVIYAVLLALVVVAVWEQFESAREVSEHEANAVDGLYHLAAGLPAKDQRPVQDKVKAYAQIVVNEEWPLMRRGHSSERAAGALDELWPILTASEPQSSRESAIYQEALHRMDDLASARQERLLDSRTTLPPILWLVLAGGAVSTIGFTYFFGVRRLAAQALMTVALAATISLGVFLILAMDLPFTGDVSVSPQALEQVLATLE